MFRQTCCHDLVWFRHKNTLGRWWIPALAATNRAGNDPDVSLKTIELSDVLTYLQKCPVFVTANTAGDCPEVSSKKYIQWFHALECFNSVLNCGQWLGCILGLQLRHHHPLHLTSAYESQVMNRQGKTEETHCRGAGMICNVWHTQMLMHQWFLGNANCHHFF